MMNACTIIAANYLPFAKVLAESFLSHHPDGSLTVLVIDDEARQLPTDDPRIDWRRLRDIGFDDKEIRRLAGIYEVTELSTAIKPVLLKHLLAEGKDPILYFDPDICIYRPLTDVALLAAQHGIVLTPHTTKPYPKDEQRVDAFFVLAAGVYNLGFIGVGSRATSFLDWWWQSTRREALIDVANMMFTDQRWIDFVPGLFDHYILKDPTCNVAYWNLHGRELTASGDRYFVDGAPLHFFHFSGFEINRPWLLSRHQGDTPRVLLSDRPALAQICREYASRIRGAGFDPERNISYGWSVSASGMPMTQRIRRLYRKGLIAAEVGKVPEPPDPFDESTPQAFVDWLNAPSDVGRARVSRFLHSIYQDRLDLQIHFRDLNGKDATRYAHWIAADGVKQEAIHPALVPVVDNVVEVVDTPASVLTEGINIAGYFRAELGIGEAARLLTQAIDAAGIPHSTTVCDATLSRQNHPFDERRSEARYDVNVICVNADTTNRFAADAGREFFDGRYTIGYWFWELEHFPDVMHPAFDVVDEVWAATDFVAAAVRAVGKKPVFTVPLPVPVPRRAPHLTREHLGLPDRFTFLFVFDFLSVLERKNPLGLIAAFEKAFAPNEGPVLLLKSINGHLRLTELERVRVAIAGRDDILLVDGYYTSEERDALVGLCDCYVSLHRSEGLGLTMVEAMVLGKPVVATAYSGNLQFMTPQNSYLVDYTLSAVPAGCEPYVRGSVWADPDLDHAGRRMREVYERPEAASAKGRRARQDVLLSHNNSTSGRAIAHRLEQIRGSRRSSVAAPQESSPPATHVGTPETTADLDEIRSLRHLLPRLNELYAPRLSGDGRPFPTLRIAAQRILFRVLRPYWFQRRLFDQNLLAFLGHVSEALSAGHRASQAAEARSARSLATTAAALEERWQSSKAAADALVSAVQNIRKTLPGVDAEVKRLEACFSTLSDDAGLMRARVGSVETRLQPFQSSATERLNDLTGNVERLHALISGVQDGFRKADARLREVEAATDARLHERADVVSTLNVLTSDVTDDRAQRGTFEVNAAAHLKGLTEAVQRLEVSTSTLSDRLFAVPYMAHPERLLQSDSQGQRLGYTSTNGGRPPTPYLHFLDVFRGSEELIRSRQRPYVPLLTRRDMVVDVACGRGEMLDLLSEAGVPAVGVDINPDMVAHCKAKGYVVEEANALCFLERQSPGSVPAIFSAQFIEHLTFDELNTFLKLCRNRLRPGGVFIAETVNPHALEAFKTFYTDLTHQRPIFPEVALTLCELAGFERAHVMFPLGSGDLETDRQSQGEYAVVATSMAPD